MRRGLLICMIAAASLATAACGGGAANALQSVASAAEKTAGTDSVRFHMNLSESVGPIGPLTFTADGLSDNTAKTAEMNMDLSSVAAFAGSQAGSPDQWKAHFILDDGIFYMRLPALDSYLNGKTWVKADLMLLARTGDTVWGNPLEPVLANPLATPALLTPPASAPAIQ